MENIVLSITEEKFIRMKVIAMDSDAMAALEFLRVLLKRVESKKKG
jgi:hypothetical protein